MNKELEVQSYGELLKNLKQEISSARIKAHLAVNKEMICLYWNIGKQILERQEKEGWGSKIIENISKDLRSEFPEMTGLSYQNISYMRQFVVEYEGDENILQQPVGEIPWGHNITLFSRIDKIEERLWYARQTVENGWSRNVLSTQINTNLYERSGKSINNFKATLPEVQSDLAISIVKDPYNIEFLDIKDKLKERDLEEALIEQIRKFLLELGSGFAFIGNQYHIELEGEVYFLDMVFYHVKLKCYVIIELKTGKFKPEYAGKMNFYINLMNKKVKDDSDNPTIGLILCEDKKTITVEYAIEGIKTPIGISQLKLTEKLPEELKPYLPTQEELKKLK